jgi:glycine receptor alpha-3
MNLKYFPLDSQLCPIEIESCEFETNVDFFDLQPGDQLDELKRFLIFLVGFTTNEIWYKWVDSPKAVSIFPEVELPQFQVMGYRKREYSYSLTTGTVAWRQHCIS